MAKIIHPCTWIKLLQFFTSLKPAGLMSLLEQLTPTALPLAQTRLIHVPLTASPSHRTVCPHLLGHRGLSWDWESKATGSMANYPVKTDPRVQRKINFSAWNEDLLVIIFSVVSYFTCSSSSIFWLHPRTTIKQHFIAKPSTPKLRTARIRTAHATSIWPHCIYEWF